MSIICYYNYYYTMITMMSMIYNMKIAISCNKTKDNFKLLSYKKMHSNIIF